MIIGILFWLLALTCCAYAAIFGGSEGRWASVLIIAASVLTIVAAALGSNWAHTEWPRFVVDALLLAGFYALMLRSRYYWPIWITGFHLIAVTTHASTLIAPSYTPAIYRALQSFWAIPVLISMVVGITVDRRHGRKARTGAAHNEPPHDNRVG